jgi:hypothetical protein
VTLAYSVAELSVGRMKIIAALWKLGGGVIVVEVGRPVVEHRPELRIDRGSGGGKIHGRARIASRCQDPQMLAEESYQ